MNSSISERDRALYENICTSTEAYPLTRKIVIGFLGALARILYRPRIKGQENLALEGPFFLVGNHLSLLDLLLIHPLMKRNITWVAKIELFRMPIIGELVRRLGAIPLDRQRTDISAVKAIMTTSRNGGVIGIFPQGTRVRWEQMNEHLPRAGTAAMIVRSGAPIIPFAIRGPYKIFHRTEIAFGNPYQLNANPQTRYAEEALQAYSIELMRRSFELIDIKYLPERSDEEDRLAITKVKVKTTQDLDAATHGDL